MATKLLPVVDYTGGKRRLLPFLRPYFVPEEISLYVEPYVGMGAVYLDLRARGYTGPAVLADSNRVVQEFWRGMHHPQESAEILLEADRLSTWPVTEDGFRQMMQEVVADRPARVARFLWLTNFMYANLPPTYVEDTGWVAARSSGSKIKSAAKWNKTFPWTPCVKRLEQVRTCLTGRLCIVGDDAQTVLSTLPDTASVFADPPYLGRAKYDRRSGASAGHVAAVFGAKGQIVLTEMLDVTPPDGWTKTAVSVLSRQAGPWNGAGASRKEFIYSNVRST